MIACDFFGMKLCSSTSERSSSDESRCGAALSGLMRSTHSSAAEKILTNQTAG